MKFICKDCEKILSITKAVILTTESNFEICSMGLVCDNCAKKYSKEKKVK